MEQTLASSDIVQMWNDHGMYCFLSIKSASIELCCCVLPFIVYAIKDDRYEFNILTTCS